MAGVFRALDLPARAARERSGGYALVRALSLDVAAGAVAGGILAAHVAGVRLPLAWWPILAASVWAAYTADHLLDATRADAACRSPRHRLHRDRHATLAVAWAAVTVAAAAVAVATLPREVVVSGALVVAAVLVHLLLAQSRIAVGVPKEVGAAAIYAAGIWFAPLVRTDRPLPPLLALAALHASAAFLNLAAVAWFERGQDREDRARSLAVSLGRRRLRRRLRRFATGAFAFGTLGAVATARAGPPALPAAFAILAALQVVPVALMHAARRTRRGALYRAVGDVAFLACAVAAAWPAR